MKKSLLVIFVLITFVLVFGLLSCDVEEGIPPATSTEETETTKVPETTVPPETTDVPTVTEPEFEAFMNLDGFSEDAKSFFRAAKEKSGYSIVDRTLTVENGTITVEGGMPIDDKYTDFRAVYGEGTAEFMEYVEEAINIGYWEFYPDLLTPGKDRVPYSAVLWRDGVSTNIDVNDPRLIMLVNMYNNSMYHHEFGQTQGSLDNITYKKYIDAPVRLELTFERDRSYHVLSNNKFIYNDKIIISCPEGEMGGFIVIYSDEETNTSVPEDAMIRYPYEMYYMDWLRLVGFVE